jgi:hypothetical protein
MIQFISVLFPRLVGPTIANTDMSLLLIGNFMFSDKLIIP